MPSIAFSPYLVHNGLTWWLIEHVGDFPVWVMAETKGEAELIWEKVSGRNSKA